MLPPEDLCRVGTPTRVPNMPCWLPPWESPFSRGNCMPLPGGQPSITAGQRGQPPHCFPGPPITNTTSWRLEQQQGTSSQFWSPEAQSMGVSRIGSFWGLGGTVCSKATLWASGSLRSSLPCKWCSLCVFTSPSLYGS